MSIDNSVPTRCCVAWGKRYNDSTIVECSKNAVYLSINCSDKKDIRVQRYCQYCGKDIGRIAVIEKTEDVKKGGWGMRAVRANEN